MTLAFIAVCISCTLLAAPLTFSYSKVQQHEITVKCKNTLVADDQTVLHQGKEDSRTLMMLSCFFRCRFMAAFLPFILVLSMFFLSDSFLRLSFATLAACAISFCTWAGSFLTCSSSNLQLKPVLFSHIIELAGHILTAPSQSQPGLRQWCQAEVCPSTDGLPLLAAVLHPGKDSQ